MRAKMTRVYNLRSHVCQRKYFTKIVLKPQGS